METLVLVSRSLRFVVSLVLPLVEIKSRVIFLGKCRSFIPILDRVWKLRRGSAVRGVCAIPTRVGNIRTDTAVGADLRSSAQPCLWPRYTAIFVLGNRSGLCVIKKLWHLVPAVLSSGFSA